MKTTFPIPSTPMCKVIFERGGVKYSTVIKTPPSNDSLQCVMLGRQVAASQIKSVEPIQPRQDFQWGHPVRVDKFNSEQQH